MILFDKRKALEAILGPSGEEIKKEDLDPLKASLSELIEAVNNKDVASAVSAFRAAFAGMSTEPQQGGDPQGG